jgi:D-amino-acid dehydrogenase
MSRMDVVVLGAGMVGVSTALQSPGEETSYGNAGVLGGAGVYPTGFPPNFRTLLRVALKIAPQANFHWADLPALAPFLWPDIASVSNPLALHWLMSLALLNWEAKSSAAMHGRSNERALSGV